jgi:YidC/Oxa1 family membrane protein insertase
MEFDRKTILAFVLIGLLLILVNTDFYQKLMLGNVPKRPAADSTAVPQPDMAQAHPETETARLSSPKSFELTANPDTSAAINFAKERAAEKEIHIETPLYSGTFSTLGASLKNWQFKKYSDHNGNPVSLFNNGADNLVLQLPTIDDSLHTGQLNFTADYQFGKNLSLQAGDKRDLVFTRYLAEGKLIRKTYSLSGDEYTVRLKIEFVNLRDILQGYSYLLSWHTGLAVTEPRPTEDMGYAMAYSLANKELDEFDVGSEVYKRGGSDDWPAQWAAVRNKYFTVAIIPQGQTTKGVRYEGRTTKFNKDVIHKSYRLDLAMPLERDRDFGQEFTVYIGPLDYDKVKGLGVGLDGIMNFGWKIIQPISKLVLWTFKFLNSFIPNYGLVIVLFSILVKIVLHPLTKKSYQSMQEMQRIQPEMTRLREKYANEPQKMNMEMMKLYKEHGVNPMGGCLPMLLQMPLLYALFIVFRSTIELRQAPFFGWIKDLSAPDSIYTLPFSIPLYGNLVCVLPLVMGATMFIQQAMTMKDPKQKAMVYMMPIIMTLAFNSFPSGLNLYYTLFNVWSILQQKYMPIAAPEKKEKKKSYKQFVADWRKHGVNSLLSKRRLK